MGTPPFVRKPHTERFQMLFDTWGRTALRHYQKLHVIFERARGCELLDVDGNRFLDATSGYSAVNLGHNNPLILNAVDDYFKHGSNEWGRPNVVPNRAASTALIEYLDQITLRFGFTRFIPMNSGAEAVETAVKLALKWGYLTKRYLNKKYRHGQERAIIVVAEGNFHGRTRSNIMLSSTDSYKDYFGPYPDMVRMVRYGDIDHLRDTLRATKKRAVAFLVEPIQGEGGVIVPPHGYLLAAKELCEKHHVLFIADEIQTGLGRAGYMLACEKEGVHPDMAILGKSLGGGINAASGVLLDEEVAVFEPGDHGSTYAGNPFAATIAATVLRALEDGGTSNQHHSPFADLHERSRKIGAYLRSQLERELLERKRSPYVKEIRGQAMMLGVAFKRGVKADAMTEKILDGGVLSIAAHDAARVCLPLIATHDECDEVAERIGWALRE